MINDRDDWIIFCITSSRWNHQVPKAHSTQYLRDAICQGLGDYVMWLWQFGEFGHGCNCRDNGGWVKKASSVVCVSVCMWHVRNVISYRVMFVHTCLACMHKWQTVTRTYERMCTCMYTRTSICTPCMFIRTLMYVHPYAIVAHTYAHVHTHVRPPVCSEIRPKFLDLNIEHTYRLNIKNEKKH